MRPKPMLIVGGLFAVGVALGSFAPSVLRAQESTLSAVTCTGPFEATVRQGPSAGTDLKGQLAITLDETGAVSGNFVVSADQSIPVAGQVTGRAINLVFDLSTAKTPGVYLFGVGTALDPVQSDTCGTALGGPFVGPMPGDSGDWITLKPPLASDTEKRDAQTGTGQ